MDYSYDSGNIKVLDDGCFVVNGTCAESDDIIGWYSEFGFLIKFDSDGNIIWAKKDSLDYNPEIWEHQSATFAVLPDDGFVSAGSVGLINPDYLLFRDSEGNQDHIIYYNDMNYNSMCVVDNETALLFAGACSDGAVLQKTDLSGNEIWRQSYGSTTASCPVSVIQCSDGGYAFLSYQFATPDDYCLVKTDSSGTVDWWQTYDYNGQSEKPNSVIQTSDDGYLLCGYTYTPDFGGFIVKTDAGGDTLWTRKYNAVDFYSVYNAVEWNDSYVLFGSNMNNGMEVLANIQVNGDFIWYKELPMSGLTYAEHPMQSNENGFICYMRHDDMLYLIQANEEGIVSIDQHELPISSKTSLSCYPNPFNPNTTISYSIPAAATVELSIYNVKGQKVVTLVNQHQEAGEYATPWNGTDSENNPVASGVYFYRLSDDHGNNKVQKCLLLK